MQASWQAALRMMMTFKENRIIAERLREAASLLEQQEANRFRVAAYRKAAGTVESLPQDVGLLLRTEGFQGLRALPGIGPQIGGAIVEMVRTGQWTQLDARSDQRQTRRSRPRK